MEYKNPTVEGKEIDVEETVNGLKAWKQAIEQTSAERDAAKKKNKIMINRSYQRKKDLYFFFLIHGFILSKI